LSSSVLVFYKNHKSAILFNKNLVIAATCSAILSSVFSDLYFNIQSEKSEGGDLINSVLTLAIEYSIDTPIFAFLYYRNNRHLYVNSLTGKKDTSKIKNDVKKLFAVFSITDVMYVVVRIASQYQLLQQTNLDPFQASIFSSFLAWISFFVLANIAMNLFDRFKRDEFFWFSALVLSMNVVNSLILFSEGDSRLFFTNITADTTSAIALLSVVLLIHKQQRSSSSVATKSAFLYLAAAMAFWLTAELLWTHYQLGLGIEVPFPSLADVFWLIGYPFLILHMYKILAILRKRTKLPSTKSIMIISSVLAIIFGYTLSQVYGLTSVSSLSPFGNSEVLGNIILISYPILDAIIIVPAVTILWSLRKGERHFIHWILISCFIVMVTVGDIGFGYSNALGQETAEREEWIWDTFFNAGYLSVAAAIFWYNRFLVGRNS
jgi:hypothetical protein